MEARDKALRAQDIQTAFQGLDDLPSLIEGELVQTVLTGMAARLATHIRGAEVFEEDDVPRLRAVAKSLDVQSTLLRNVLGVLEEAEMVQVRSTPGGSIKLVRESIPAYGDLYSRIGEVYESKDRTEIEEALLTSFHSVVEGPKIEDEELPIQRIGDRYRIPLLDLADQSSLIRVGGTTRLGRKIYYSPQYWDEHPDRLIDSIQRYGDERVREIIARVRNEPGLPLPRPGDLSAEAEILRVLTESGVLPSPTVAGLRGEVGFAFTPMRGQGEDPTLDAKILEKTRAILSCVRYGQHFGTVTTVHTPLKLLRALQSKGRIGSHSDVPTQYRLLVEQGVGRISRDKDYSSRYFLHFIRTPENETALAAAIDLLEAGVPIAATHVNQDVRHYAMDSEYVEPATARARRKFTPSHTAAAHLRAEIIDILVTE